MQEPEGAIRPGWPFILPDNAAVIFARTDSADFSGNGAGVMKGGAGPGAAERAGPYSELSILDRKSGTVTLLARAMGYATPADAVAGKTFLPFGAEDIRHNYFPTVSPVAAGGYFWLFFDGVRHYGSLGSGRQLWGAAIDISPDGSYTTDPSHPAFYLPGQELGTGNHRAFAALDACKRDGDGCTSGIDCCGGACHFEGEIPVGSCTSKKSACSMRDERCTHDQDCCLGSQCAEPQAAWPSDPGGFYAPDIIEPWITDNADGSANVYWHLSTWNPYQVLLMRTTFAR